MKPKGFTLIEMIVVMAVLSIIILIVVPVMRDLLFDFEEKSNKQVYEQMYKATKLYYAEVRSNRDINDNLIPMATAFPANSELLERTWADVISYSANMSWFCVDTDLLLNKGYLKKDVLDEVKGRVGIDATTPYLYVILVAERVDERVIIRDSALIKKTTATC